MRHDYSDRPKRVWVVEELTTRGRWRPLEASIVKAVFAEFRFRFENNVVGMRVVPYFRQGPDTDSSRWVYVVERRMLNNRYVPYTADTQKKWLVDDALEEGRRLVPYFPITEKGGLWRVGKR